MPRKKHPDNLERVTIRLPEDAIAKLRVYNPGVSAAEVIRWLVRKYIKETEAQAERLTPRKDLTL